MIFGNKLSLESQKVKLFLKNLKIVLKDELMSFESIEREYDFTLSYRNHNLDKLLENDKIEILNLDNNIDVIVLDVISEFGCKDGDAVSLYIELKDNISFKYIISNVFDEYERDDVETAIENAISKVLDMIGLSNTTYDLKEVFN